MKFLLGLKQAFLVTAFTVAPLFVFAGGTGPGGGDHCEDRIQIIRDDIKNWIDRGGPAKGLKLPTGLDVGGYSSLMNKAIAESKIKCVKPGDVGHPVMVGQTPKVCRFDEVKGDTKPYLITCDYKTFMDKITMIEDDQYSLVHHEYAGVAGIENPEDDISTYSLSNQITSYLETQVVKKLVVKEPEPTFEPKTKTYFFPAGTQLVLKRDLSFAPGEKTIEIRKGNGLSFTACYFILKNGANEERVLRAGKVLTVVSAEEIKADAPFTGGFSSIKVDNSAFQRIGCVTVFNDRPIEEWFPLRAARIETFLQDWIEVRPSTPEEIP